MRNLTILLIFLSFIFSSLKLYAQESDSSWQRLQVSNATNSYNDRFLGPNSFIYQGDEYIPYTLPVNGNAFYQTNNWQDGSVFYKGKLYSHLPLLYDIYKDQLVLQNWNKIYRILLSPQNISWFTLGTHYFIRIKAGDSSDKSIPPSGYYEELVRGQTTLLVKRIKTVIVPTTTSTTSKFIENNLYYIEKEGHYYPVRTKRSLLNILRDHKKMIKQYLRKNGIKFGLNREAAMVEMVKYENRLSNKEE